MLMSLGVACRRAMADRSRAMADMSRAPEANTVEDLQRFLEARDGERAVTVDSATRFARADDAACIRLDGATPANTFFIKLLTNLFGENGGPDAIFSVSARVAEFGGGKYVRVVVQVPRRDLEYVRTIAKASLQMGLAPVQAQAVDMDIPSGTPAFELRPACASRTCRRTKNLVLCAGCGTRTRRAFCSAACYNTEWPVHKASCACAGCGVDSSAASLRRCGGCLRVGYCGPECQRAARRAHKAVCHAPPVAGAAAPLDDDGVPDIIAQLAEACVED